MWNVNPAFMCDAHLLGEHRELHMIDGALRKGMLLMAHIERGLVEPGLVTVRHTLLAQELEARGMQHWSPLSAIAIPPDLPIGYVCERVGRHELSRRCVACRARMAERPYQSLRPPHQCDERCQERVRRDEAARPRANEGIARERSSRPGRRQSPRV